MFPQELPIGFLNNAGYNFEDPLHRSSLEATLNEIKPVLVIFDPLYLMFDGEINSAKELNPVLGWLLEIKNNYNVAVMVIHHWNKNGVSSRGGQRMLGSTTLHGWTESAIYMQSQGGEDESVAKVILEREFRGTGLFPKLDMEIRMGQPGTPFYEVRVEKAKAGNPVDLLDLLSMYPGGMSARNAAEELGVARRTIAKLVEDSKGKILLEKNRLRLK
jgi:hypothetical protein